MRDERVQALGSFQEGCRTGDKAIKGSKLTHEKLIGFINRNYSFEVGAGGEQQWYFQNGPQKVYVELACTPYIWRLSKEGEVLKITSHNGLAANYQGCQLDDLDRLYLRTDLGIGLVHSMDVHLAGESIEKGTWSLEPDALARLS